MTLRDLSMSSYALQVQDLVCLGGELVGVFHVVLGYDGELVGVVLSMQGDDGVDLGGTIGEWAAEGCPDKYRERLLGLNR
jgi:hypothetical protein